MIQPSLSERLRRVRLLAMDVDGVLTPGGITLGTDGEGTELESKTFHVRDGLGIGLALAAGLEVAWITGRRSAVVERRAQELGVRHVCQGVRNKGAALGALVASLGLEAPQVLFIGDDLNDLPAFEAAGVAVSVADAASRARERAEWVTGAPGGLGAVREVVEAVLTAQSRLAEAEAAFLARLPAEQHGSSVQ